MTTISTDLYADITFTLLKCELIDNIADLLLTNTHVNHIGRNIVQIAYRNAKQQPPNRIDADGTKHWEINGSHHRDWPFPAVVKCDEPFHVLYPDLVKYMHPPPPRSVVDNYYHFEWWNHGVKHRCGDKPAVAHANGRENIKEWWKNGKQHRDNDKPATITTSAWGATDLHWICNGIPHRDNDKPASIWEGNDKAWYKNGKIHRDNDKPASVSIHPNGAHSWYKNGEHHRDGDLPAVISNNGSKQWFKNGHHHRDGDLPAVILSNGTKIWAKNGTKHRDGDLPAVIRADGTNEWYNNGVQYTPEK